MRATTTRWRRRDESSRERRGERDNTNGTTTPLVTTQFELRIHSCFNQNISISLHRLAQTRNAAKRSRLAVDDSTIPRARRGVVAERTITHDAMGTARDS